MSVEYGTGIQRAGSRDSRKTTKNVHYLNFFEEYIILFTIYSK
jgi:hypothetical protein